MPDLIRNLAAKMQSITVGQTTFPLTLSSGPNCYICDPTVAYIDYAVEETRNFTTQPILQKTLLGLINACKPLLHATGLDHQVQPNNWLFSTNPVPTLTADDAAQLRDTLTNAHPDRAIVLRSLNMLADKTTMDALQGAGFKLIPLRQIYIFDPAVSKKPTIDIKRDDKLYAATDYQIAPASDFSADDYSRAAELYDMLYLNKYTALNPQYTASFLAQAHQIGLLKITGLRGPDGTLDGIIGLFQNGDTLTVPILGYDTTKPQKLGLYRMLNVIGHTHAVTYHKFYNMSAGAAAFKRNRGAKPVIEYSAVYVAHLRLRARTATRITKALLDWIGVPLLKRFQL